MSGGPRPKYQVFISSTFRDLRQVREAVTWAVLGERHIPAGMESFPATSDRGWRIIQKTIDVSDYYVVLIAGRYGDVDPSTGQSWTEREYDYAVSKGVPVLAFIRRDAAITSDQADDDKTRVRAFKERLRTAHLCSDWSDEKELVSQVTQALRHQISDDEDSDAARPGWFRGDQVPSIKTMTELARLSEENAKLREALAKASAGQAMLELREVDRDVLSDRTEQIVPYTARDSRYEHALYYEVSNSGPVTAHNVRVSLAFKGAEYSLAFVPDGAGVLGGSRDVVRDRRNPVYVDEVRDSGSRAFEVVQRVRSLGPGATEHLMAIRLFFRRDEATAGSHELRLVYALSCDDAPARKGTQTLTMNVRDRE